MNLNIVRVPVDGLKGDARSLQQVRKEPFFFLWHDGKLFMNQTMQGAKEATGALETMWKYDHAESESAMDDVNAAYEIIKATAGSTAARQASEAWQKAAQASRKAKATEKAAAWIKAGNSGFEDETWEQLADLDYDEDFLHHGLFKAFHDLHEENPNDPRYREYLLRWADAALIYGFHLGQQAGAATGSAVKDDLLKRIPQLTEEKARLVSVVVNEFLR